MSKKKIIIGIIIVVAIGLFIYGKKKNGSVTVTAVEVEQIVVQKTVSASGTVTSISESNLALPATGQIQNVHVEKGEKVSKGTLLSNIYNFDTSQNSQAAKDNRDVAKRDLEIYIENYLTNLDGAGGHDEYNLNVKRLQELQSKAEASYQASLGTLTKTLLYAPFDGTIIDIFAEAGEVVVAGGSIIKIADLTNLVFEIDVDQEDFGLLEIGQRVEVTLDSYDDVTFTGVVLELPQYADEETDEFQIKIDLEQSYNQPVLLGMNGDASIIILESATEMPSLTFDVLYQNGEGSYVWTDDNGKLKKTFIEIGLEGDVYTEVTSSLEGVNIVVPVDENDLEEGTKVKYEE